MGVFSKLASLTIAALALSSCSFIKNAQQSFHQSFRQGFQKSYLQACETRPDYKSYCECTMAWVSSKYSDEELIKLTTSDTETMKTVMSQAAHACASKLPKGVTVQ